MEDIKEITDPELMEWAYRERPDLVKAWVEANKVDPKELLENEKGLLEREMLEKFLREQGYLKEAEEKVEEKAAEIEKAVEKVKATEGTKEWAKKSPEKPEIARIATPELFEEFPNICLL